MIDFRCREALGQHVESQEQIQTIEFSPDGKLMAVGSHVQFNIMYIIIIIVH